jgi:hypothetical protein
MKSILSCTKCNGTGEISNNHLLCDECFNSKPDWNELMTEVEIINSGACAIHIDSTHTFLHFPLPNKMLDWRHVDHGGMLVTTLKAVIAYREFIRSRD